MRLAPAFKSLAALAIPAGLMAMVLAVLGASPRAVCAALWSGAFGDWQAVTDTMVKATPILFCGLAAAIAFKGSLWNIGAEGQLLIGALAAGAIGPRLGPIPRPIAIAAMMIAGLAGGALWGGLAGWLRARRDVNEVIGTIMLNFVAVQILSWAVHGPLIEATRSYPKSGPIAMSAEMPLYFAPSRLNGGMLVALILALACYLFLFHTTTGFELRAIGLNRRAAAFFGLPIARLTILAMGLSGALAGLGGALQVSAITHRLYESMSPGWGYEGIAAALVARLNPIALVPAAMLFGALDNGAQAMQRTQGVSPVLAKVIQGLVIMILLALDTSAIGGLGCGGGRRRDASRESLGPAPSANPSAADALEARNA
jgi:general nucleoside transport system permease protein